MINWRDVRSVEQLNSFHKWLYGQPIVVQDEIKDEMRELLATRPEIPPGTRVAQQTVSEPEEPLLRKPKGRAGRFRKKD